MNRDALDFPPAKLRRLEEKITNPNEMVPVFPEEELECLLNASINLCQRGVDVQNEACQKFFHESLTSAFTKILKNDAVNNWTPLAHDCINKHCERLVKLCIHKLDDDLLPLLDLLAMVFDPSNKFHTFTAAKQSESVPHGSNIPDDNLYARPPARSENPRGWLVDLINKFGNLGGFAVLFTRFQSCRRILTIPMIRVLLRPFELCHELLTISTIDRYFLPIFERVREIFDNLTDEELKLVAQKEAIDHDISVIIETMTSLALRMPKHEDVIANVESSRVKMILRLLTIVENSSQILSSFVFILSSEELNRFFEGVQKSWITGNTAEREILLDFIHRRLLADGHYGGIMHVKVLTAFWNLARSDDISTQVMDLALDTHLQFLNYPGAQHRDALKTFWLDQCVIELKNNSNWTLPAIKQIRKICNLMFELQENRDPNNLLRFKKEAIARLQTEHSICTLIRSNLRSLRHNTSLRANYMMELQERLNFYTFVLKNGRIKLNIDEIQDMWWSLAWYTSDQYTSDQSENETFLKWFSDLFTEKIINAAAYKQIFARLILKLDAESLTDSGFTCFENFFKEINANEGKLQQQDQTFFVDDVKLIGMDYLWQIVINSEEEIALRGAILLKALFTNLGPRLRDSVSTVRMMFIAECTSRQQKYCDILTDLTKDCFIRGRGAEDRAKKIAMRTISMSRVTKVLIDYVEQCKNPLPAIANNGAYTVEIDHTY